MHITDLPVSVAALAFVATAVVAPASEPTMGPITELSATPHDQWDPAVAYDHEHDQYLLVWDQEGSNGVSQIVGRVVSSGGVSVGNDFLISEEAIRNQQNPDLAYDPSNDKYLVVWDVDLEDQNGYDIMGRNVAYDGTPVNTPFFVNTTAGRDEHHPCVALADLNDIVLPDRFLVAWQTDVAGSRSIIEGILLNTDGSFGSSVIEIENLDTADLGRPRAAYSASKRLFVVVYEAEYAVDNRDFRIARLTHEGVVTAWSFIVGDYEAARPDVAACGERILSVWSGTTAGVTGTWGVMVEDWDVGDVVAIDTSANPFVVGTAAPAVACRTQTVDFLVLWQVSFSFQSDRFIWANTVRADEFAGQVFAVGADSVNGGDFTAPAIAGRTGHALAVWQFREGEFEFQDLAGRLIELPVFTDDFESGDDAGWSSSTP